MCAAHLTGGNSTAFLWKCWSKKVGNSWFPIFFLSDCLPAAKFLMTESTPYKGEPIDFPGSWQFVLWCVQRDRGPCISHPPLSRSGRRMMQNWPAQIQSPRHTICIVNPHCSPKRTPAFRNGQLSLVSSSSQHRGKQWISEYKKLPHERM